jgi:organic hydroperoxide reductase OsmC/OhrA
MPSPFPHHYSAELSWEDESTGTIRAGARPPIPGGPPPEFDGSEKVWSPEHLLLSASNLCLMTTFMSLARKTRLAVKGYKGRVEAVLDKTPAGLEFTSMTVHVELKVEPGKAEEGRKLLEKAKKYCIVSNALKIPETLVAQVTDGN